MDELEKNERLADLYALYGHLLTPGQRDYFEDYYYNDLSLGEIADNHHVSRQAVYDNLKRSANSLIKYDQVLQLSKTFDLIEEKIEDAKQQLADENVEAARLILDKLLVELRGE